MKTFKAIVTFFTLAIALSMALAACQSPAQTDSGKPSEKVEIQNSTAQDTETKNNKPENQEDNSHEIKGKTFTAKVIKVIDGDTVKIRFGGRDETVRLLLIDTPETVHPTKPEQPFGREASNFMKKLLPAGVQIQVEPGIGERDKYGRLLAYFYVKDQMINKMLLEKGLARVAYVYAPNTKYIDEFREVEKEAKNKEAGIWSIENYATSQGFDDSKAERIKNQASDKKDNSCENTEIKGNISSHGDKIYHVPSGQFYQITKAEELFCTEADAVNAGFRKSQR
jgi:micrococcal nuclease